MSVTIETYAHIPGLKLPEQEQIILNNCKICTLPFEQWINLEDPCFCEVERRYQNNAPVFIYRELEYNDSAEFKTALDANEVPIFKDAEKFSQSIFLAMSVTIPDPSRSIVYFHDKSEDVNIRITGLNEREFIFTPYDNTEIIDKTYFDRIKAMYDLVTRYDDNAYVEVARLIESYNAFRLPQLTSADAIVHLVAAFEDVINRQSDRPLGDTFARRCGMLLSYSFEDVAGYEKAFRLFYSLRSDTLHGIDVTNMIPTVSGMSVGQFMFYATIKMCGYIINAIQNHSQDLHNINTDHVLNILVKEIDMIHDAKSYDDFHKKYRIDWLES